MASRWRVPAGVRRAEAPAVLPPEAVEEAPHPAFETAGGAQGLVTSVEAARTWFDPRLRLAWVLPGILLLLLLVVFPLFMEVYISLTDWSPISSLDWFEAYKVWAALDNYADGLTSSSFLSAVARTLLITVSAVACEALLGFVLAVAFVRRFPLKRVATVLMLLPMMIVPAVAGFVFFLLLQSNGPVNAILGIFWPGDVEIPWLVSKDWAPVAVALVDVWQWTPLMFLIFLSGLLALPVDQMEAAEMLGLSWWQRMRWLVLPMMKPIILIALIIRAMEAFKIFDAAWLLTQGGPGEASSTISVKLYRDAFLSSNWSLAAALAIMVMIFVSLVAMWAVRPLERAQEGHA